MRQGLSNSLSNAHKQPAYHLGDLHISSDSNTMREMRTTPGNSEQCSVKAIPQLYPQGRNDALRIVSREGCLMNTPLTTTPVEQMAPCPLPRHPPMIWANIEGKAISKGIKLHAIALALLIFDTASPLHSLPWVSNASLSACWQNC